MISEFHQVFYESNSKCCLKDIFFNTHTLPLLIYLVYGNDNTLIQLFILKGMGWRVFPNIFVGVCITGFQIYTFGQLIEAEWHTCVCVGNLTIIGSDNGLSPGQRQAITWTNVGILLIGSLGTNFSEIIIEIHIFSFKKIHLKMSSGKWRPFCLGLNVLRRFQAKIIPLPTENGPKSYPWHK